MKLFGTSRKGQHVKSRSKAKSENQYTVSNPQIAEAAQQTAVAQKPTPKGPLVWWKSLALPLKFLMIFAVIMVAAVIAIAIWWKLNVKPPETSTSTTTSVASTKTTTVTKIDAQTGEEYEVEVYEDEEEAFQTPTRVVTVVDEDTGEEYEYEVPVSKKEGLYNILIVGTDGDGGRTDTIMIASLDTTTHSVALMSIPRDTYINANYSVPKINSAYGAGGMGESGIAALENQLAKMLGFEVDGYVMVDLDGFVEIVDLIGGVEFDVPMNMYYSDPTQDL